MGIRIITMSVALTLCLLVTAYAYWRYKMGSQSHRYYFQGFFFLGLGVLLTLTRKLADFRHPVYLLGLVLLLISVCAGMFSLYKGWKMSTKKG